MIYQDNTGPMPLQRWLWRAFLRSAVIPLLFIELGFLGVYWISAEIGYRANTSAVQNVADQYFVDVATREASVIAETLHGVESLTGMFVRESRRALVTPYDPPASEKSRYQLRPDGSFITVRDNGGSATFYSGIVPVGPKEIAKVWRTSQIDPVFRNIKESNPLISQLYINTFDSYNRIYPYMDTSVYPAKMDIPSYNFYYEADSGHNPQRKVVWTDAYIDPAGQGWMVSSIAPIYVGNRLEGVAGIDITIKQIVNRILDTALPWNGYAMLVGRDGAIIAMPKDGESDFHLKMMRDHEYTSAITGDTFRPDDFNIRKRPDLQQLGKALFAKKSGKIVVKFDGIPHVAAFAEVPGPGWRLVVIAAQSMIYSDAQRLRDRVEMVGLFMLAILILFYIVFFMLLSYRSRTMSKVLAEPLEQVTAIMDRVGAGAYDQHFTSSKVEELNRVGHHLIDMNNRLAAAEERSVLQERQIARALEHERETNESQRRFIRIMSHEIRTPLAIVDSCAEVMVRRPEQQSSEQIVARAHKIRRASNRIQDVLSRLVRLLELVNSKQRAELVPLDLSWLVNATCEEFARVGGEKITVDTAVEPGLRVRGDDELIRQILIALLENANKFSPAGTPIEVRARTDKDADEIVISVIDHGEGIPSADMPHIFDRFYRGSNATTTIGSGIGLHMARVFAASNDGRLEIDSAPDGGACVSLRLPVLHDNQYGERA
ncbi:sensor histidine kinase [Aquisediminimonas sediminicola]|uniref:sensor histidine kinase n=1 Tax=Alteraquisediminimonas sediminicola TaxID=2676787 RepID=UPI001C8ECD07|nr:sensor histidine kinase [Aquisediminimonas sediminicola]